MSLDDYNLPGSKLSESRRGDWVATHLSLAEAALMRLQLTQSAGMQSKFWFVNEYDTCRDSQVVAGQ